jgi:predicted transcriptional regulator
MFYSERNKIFKVPGRVLLSINYDYGSYTREIISKSGKQGREIRKVLKFFLRNNLVSVDRSEVMYKYTLTEKGKAYRNALLAIKKCTHGVFEDGRT